MNVMMVIQYTNLIQTNYSNSINNNELPVSGGLMAGDMFKKIVDYMTEIVQYQKTPLIQELRNNI